jgi:hypothetical protein
LFIVTDGDEVKKLTTSVETIRTSVLRAYDHLIVLFEVNYYLNRYLDLHERFTKTTELQTSALAALWKMVKNFK